MWNYKNLAAALAAANCFRVVLLSLSLFLHNMSRVKPFLVGLQPRPHTSPLSRSLPRLRIPSQPLILSLAFSLLALHCDCG